VRVFVFVRVCACLYICVYAMMRGLAAGRYWGLHLVLCVCVCACVDVCVVCVYVCVCVCVCVYVLCVCIYMCDWQRVVIGGGCSQYVCV